MGSEVIVGLITALLSGSLVAVLTHLLTKKKTQAETTKIQAETQKVEAQAEKIRTETSAQLAILEGMQSIQLTREVVFNKDDPNPASQLYWIDDKGVAHAIPERDSASVFTSQKGVLGISQGLFAKIQIGPPLPGISKHSFRRIKYDYFVLLDGKIFWLPSLSQVYRYWNNSRDVPEMDPEEFRTYQIFR